MKYPLIAINRFRMTTDGPGITTLIAGSGCPLSCKYCINGNALNTTPKMVSPEELYAMVKQDDLYFRATGGGITFGGGESLLHVKFISEFKKLCSTNWNICAESSLNVDRNLLEAAIQSINEFIIDIKTFDAHIYRNYTGTSGEKAYSNLRFLADNISPSRIKVRVPLIDGYNTPEDQKSSASKLKEMGITNIELFEYKKA